jgi:hypothetical protein
MTKLPPHIFHSTHDSNHQSRSKKVSKIGDESFPFQTLSGGIVKSNRYSVEYGDLPQAAHGSGTGESDTADADAMSAGSEEWIIMQENPKDLTRQRIKSGV